jgi:hypothetical protein
MRQFKRFVQFGKLDDDLREVWGDATVEELDKQNEIVSFAGAVKAFEANAEYFHKASGGKSKGNVRVMHQPIAAGRIIAWEKDVERKAIPIGTKIDDEVEWGKCKKGTYIGFSIAGNVTQEHVEKMDGKDVNVIDAFDLVEVSLVDNPACASAVFTVVKLAGEKRAEPIPDETPSEPVPSKGGDDLKAKLDATLGDLGKADKEPTTVQTLIFAKDKFNSSEAAKSWASEHDFKSSKVDETEDSYRLRQRDPEEFKDQSKTVELKDGVQAVIGHLKVAVPRFGKILKTMAGAMRKQGSEFGSIYPALCALRDMQNALDSEAFGLATGEDAAQEKADIAVLMTVVDGLLEFVGSEFNQEVRSWLSSNGEGTTTPFAYLDRLATMEKAFTVLQLRKMLDDGEMKENLDAIHRMGHGLVKASSAMGSDCPDGDCTDEGGDQSGEGEGEADSGDGAPPKKDGEDSGKGKALVAKPRTVLNDGEVRTEKVLREIRQVGTQVGTVKGTLKAIDDRVAALESKPAPIGRPPAEPVDKSLPGISRAALADDPLFTLRERAEKEKDPVLKQKLVMILTEESIKLASATAR